MERPKESKKHIDISNLLGVQHLKNVGLSSGADLFLSPVVDNAIFIACKDDGLEIEKEGESISIFMDEFFRLLTNEKTQLNTKQFVHILNERYTARTNGGKIITSPKHSTLKDEYFYLLKGNQKNKSEYTDSKYITWMYYSKQLEAWKIDFGEIHGLQKKDKVKLVNQKGDFRIKEMLPCQALIDDEGKLDRDKFYQVDFSQLDIASKVFDWDKSLDKNIIRRWFLEIEPLIEKWNKYTKAELELLLTEDGLAINSPYFQNPCVQILSENITDFERIFQHILDWEQVTQRKNPKSDIYIDDILSINILARSEYNDPSVQKSSKQKIAKTNHVWEETNWSTGKTILLEKEDSLSQPNPKLRIRLKGQSSQAHFVSALLLKEADYSISNSALPLAEITTNTTSIWLTQTIGNYQEPSIELPLNDIHSEANEANFILKLFITNDDKLDTDFFCKGKPDLAAFKKEKVKAARPQENLALDWSVIDIPIKVIKKGALKNETVEDLKLRANDLIDKGYANQAKTLLLDSLNEDVANDKYIDLKSLEVNDIEIIPQKKLQLENNVVNHALRGFIRTLQSSDLKASNSGLLKTQNLLWYLQKFDFLEVSTKRPQTKPQDYTPQKIGETGYFTDPRDGQQYKTVMLKDGKVWMAENLNYDVGEGCVFYNDDPENGKKYGRLYTWETAQQACPEGWYIPTKEDWENIINQYIDSGKAYTSLIEKGDSNFNALLGGRRNGGGQFLYLGKSGKYWSSTENFGDAWYYDFDSSYQDLDIGNGNKSWAHSLRCINIIIPDPKPKEYTPTNIGETGYFTDPRDGQQYKTVMLKDGKVWMAENLNYDIGDDCCFYDNKPENGEKYGRLYTWEAAQRACPEGWYFPSEAIWLLLLEQYENRNEAYKALNFESISGFSGQYREKFSFSHLGDYSLYWTNTQKDLHFAWQIIFSKKDKNIASGYVSKKGRMSCRYVKINATEESFWKSTIQTNIIQAYQNYIQQFPYGRYTEEAEKQIAKLQEAPIIIIPDTKPKDYIPQEIGETGYFTDPRDGQQYKTVMLKDGKIWMAQNLNYDIGEGGYFYSDNPENGKKYGRLYTWEAAQKACPDGWHVPSRKEWDNMIKEYGGEGEKSYDALIDGSSSGFSAQLGGYRYSNGSYNYLGKYGYYWSNTEGDANNAWYYYFYSNGNTLYHDDSGKRRSRSCRCLKN